MSNVEATKKAYAAFSAGDLETVLSILDDDTEWFLPGNSTISGTYRGKAEVTELFGKLAEKDFTIAPSRFLADDDVVVVLSMVTALGESAPQADASASATAKSSKPRASRTLPCRNGSTARSSRCAGPRAGHQRGAARAASLELWVPHTALDHRHRSHRRPRGEAHSVLSVNATVSRASSSRRW
jgi:uncharacterized protein